MDLTTFREDNAMKTLATVCLAALLWILHTDAETYYIRPGGDDQAKGTTEETAWATIGKVRSYGWEKGFGPGDSILFEASATHTTSEDLYLQADKAGGTAENPLVIGSYGQGRAIIQANGCDFINIWAPENGSVRLGLIVENLDIRGNGVPKDGPKSACGIMVWNSSASDLDLLHVRDCDITGFAGDGISTGRDGKSKGRLLNVTVHNVKAYNNPGAAGVSPHSGSGIIIAGADGALIEHCIAYENGENNDNPGGPIGIWFWDCINSTIQFCESYNNKTIKGDGGGFDLDGACQNCTIQYCYSHGNAGAGFLLAQFSGAASGYGPLENNTIRYNISENDGRKGSYGGIMFWGATSTDHVGENHVYNNTVYMGGTPANGSPSCVNFLHGNFQGIKLYNNLFVAADGHKLVNAGSAFSAGKVQFQGNGYWSESGTAFKIRWGGTTHGSLTSFQGTGQEKLDGSPVGVQGDPMLRGGGAGGTIGNTSLLASLSAYAIDKLSPMVDAGLDLQLLGIDPGNRDYWNTPIPQNAAYDIGAHEVQRSTGNRPLPRGNALGSAQRPGSQARRVYDLQGRRHDGRLPGKGSGVTVEQPLAPTEKAGSAGASVR
jgi:hypothetical protein